MDTDEITKAKALAAGPLGELMGKFPLLYAKVAFFGERPSPHKKTDIRNGTITLLNLGQGSMAITCQHVIQGYREKRAATARMIFQIGHVEIDPLAQLIAEDKRLDLATIRLTAEQAQAITSEGEIGSVVHRPFSWPPPLPKRGEFVTFGGFPGNLRSVLSFDELEFGSWSGTGSEVSSSSDFQFASVFERENWVASFGGPHQIGLTALGGMSGGPVLIKRAIAFELVGIVSQYNENYDTVFFSSVRPIRPDGSIEAPSV